MDCTDRHDRFFLRLMSKNVMLYTEMVATKSAIHGDRKKILSFSPEEKPLALQVGGSNKEELAEVAKIAEDMGYDEININLGCPSKKVQKNKFGACLIKEPDLVAECINSMVNSCKIPVTAKTRIGFDDTEKFDYLNKFIHKMRDAGSKSEEENRRDSERFDRKHHYNHSQVSEAVHDPPLSVMFGVNDQLNRELHQQESCLEIDRKLHSAKSHEEADEREGDESLELDDHLNESHYPLMKN